MLFTALPLSQTVTPSRTPSPLERDVLYGWPLSQPWNGGPKSIADQIIIIMLVIIIVTIIINLLSYLIYLLIITNQIN